MAFNAATMFFDCIGPTYAVGTAYPLQTEWAQSVAMLPAGSLLLDIYSAPGQRDQAFCTHRSCAVKRDLNRGMLQVTRKAQGTDHPALQILADLRTLPHWPANVWDGALYLGVKEGHDGAWEHKTWDSPRYSSYFRHNGIKALTKLGLLLAHHRSDQPLRRG